MSRLDVPGRRWTGLALALALAAAVPAAAAHAHDEHRDRDRGHDHARKGPVVVPDGVVVPSWDELAPEQQRHLGRLREQWDTLPASRRVQALEHAQRRARWEAMTPEQRERIRAGMRNYRDLSPELREKAREAMRTLRSLPAAEREALSRQWRAMDPEQRRAWLETGGPGISPPPKADAD